MKMKYSAFFLGCILAACTTPTTEVKKENVKQKELSKVDKKLDKKPEEVLPSISLTFNAYKRDLAQHISKMNVSSIYKERPQAFLRSVIVLKFVINADVNYCAAKSFELIMIRGQKISPYRVSVRPALSLSR